MRRTHPTILRLLTLASTTLFLAAAALWFRSYFSTDACGGTAFHSLYSATSSRGRASLTWAASAPPGFSFDHSSTRPPYTIGAYGALSRLGFFFDNRTSAAGAARIARIAIVFPTWLVLIITAILPARRLLVRSRRPSHPACPACGYDLRATPHRCPECGTEPTAIPNAQPHAK